MDTQHHPDPEPSVPVETAEHVDTEPVAAEPAKTRSGNVDKTEIGPTIVIRGKLKSSEDLIVRGRIEADITSDKSLHVKNSGIIKATVRVSSARIDGILVGNVNAEEKLEIAAEGRVVGDLHTPRIVIREGAAFKGNIDMPNFDAKRSPAPAEPVVEKVAAAPDMPDVDIDIDEAPVATEPVEAAPAVPDAGDPQKRGDGLFGRKKKKRRN